MQWVWHFASEVLGYVPVDEWDMFLWMSGDVCTSCRGIPGGGIGGRRFCGVKL